ncbi:hypothetical protein N7492_010677 [Penicillium capsulatum]|uniref:Uncharacterized protein n=1 Tax=Penicillium capsulatum TaxID=69766 RepID=A0A9W9HPE6_9EURO|nr:hypothetical protein N7492_010677 [Penicillium capsulatum]KAJ6113176.1 hypothetical protein N7512_008500 [Penicillium capsulatum]
MARRPSARPTRPTHPTRTVRPPRTPAFLAAAKYYARTHVAPLSSIPEKFTAVFLTAGREALSSTTALRTHVHGYHHMRVAMNLPGSLSSQQKESTKAFFKSIFKPTTAGQG